MTQHINSIKAINSLMFDNTEIPRGKGGGGGEENATTDQKQFR